VGDGGLRAAEAGVSAVVGTALNGIMLAPLHAVRQGLVCHCAPARGAWAHGCVRYAPTLPKGDSGCRCRLGLPSGMPVLMYCLDGAPRHCTLRALVALNVLP